MKCPFCGFTESKVIDSRPAEEGATIRRRRECLSCQKRFTTYEIMEQVPLVVIKKDGSRQTFDKVKILNGVIRACEKRPVPMADIQRVADEVEQEAQNSLEREIKTEYIGELVMDKLKRLDEVAYVRFASVYRQFKDINKFMEELNKLLKEKCSENASGGERLAPCDVPQFEPYHLGGVADSVRVSGKYILDELEKRVAQKPDLVMPQNHMGVFCARIPYLRRLGSLICRGFKYSADSRFLRLVHGGNERIREAREIDGIKYHRRQKQY